MVKIIRWLIPSVLALLNWGCQNHSDIDAYLKDKALNGNVLVIKDGETVYEKSFGYTDGSQATLLNKKFRFNTGSVYKEFPAVAIMQLNEKGSLQLNDKLAKHLPELPQWSEQITIKNLLQYSSGLPMIRWDEYFGKGLEITSDDIMEDLKNITSLEFTPGSDYSYTNYSPILLIKIVEEITQLNFNDYLTEKLLIPFNLNETLFKNRYPYRYKEKMAIPFNSELKEDSYKITLSNILFCSTTHDMYRWFEQLGDFKIINKKSVEFLSEVAKVGDNIQAPLGYCKWENGEIMEHTHHGSIANYECIVRRFKQDGISIIIMTNQKQGNVYELSDNIYEIIKRK